MKVKYGCLNAGDPWEAFQINVDPKKMLMKKGTKYFSDTCSGTEIELNKFFFFRNAIICARGHWVAGGISRGSSLVALR